MRVTEYRLTVGLEHRVTLAFASDLHNCDNEPVLAAIRASRADAVLVGGDYIHAAAVYERGFAFLQQCAKLLPTFCVLGNHEMRYGGDVRADTRQTGAQLLDNAFVSFGGLCLGGLSTGYLPGMPQQRRGLPPAPDRSFLQQFSEQPGYKLLLSHHPEYWEPYIRPLSIDLTISGHAHGGQFILPLFGGLFAPGQGFFPKYDAGRFEKNGTNMVVAETARARPLP